MRRTLRMRLFSGRRRALAPRGPFADSSGSSRTFLGHLGRAPAVVASWGMDVPRTNGPNPLSRWIFGGARPADVSSFGLGLVPQICTGTSHISPSHSTSRATFSVAPIPRATFSKAIWRGRSAGPRNLGFVVSLKRSVGRTDDPLCPRNRPLLEVIYSMVPRNTAGPFTMKHCRDRRSLNSGLLI